MKLQFKLSLVFSILLFSLFSFTHATSQVSPYLEVDVKLPKTENKIEEDIWKNFSLKTAKYCVWANKILNDFLQENKDYINQRYFNRGFFYEKSMQATTASASNVKVKGSVPTWEMNSLEQKDITNTIDSNYSWTNLQVQNVDEPEIVKMDNNHIIYLDKNSWKVYIIEQWKEANDYKIKSVLNIPSAFSVNNIFYNNKKIILLWERKASEGKEAFFDNINKTTILMFDISNPNKPIQLEEVIESPWTYDDARILNNNLYFVSNIYANPYWNYSPIEWIKEGSNMKQNKIGKVDIEKDLQPLTLLNVNNKNITEYKVKYNCSNIYFNFPNKETIEKYGIDLEFKIITKVNLNNLKDINQNIIAGSWYTFYMSEQALYITNHLSLNLPYSRWWSFLWFNSFDKDTIKTYTAIHKFNIAKSWNLDYSTSTIVPGNPLNQYSMDEYQNNFRIITNVSKWDSEKKAWTNVYILDKDLSLLWKLEWIKPDENFKSSRFINDMLYFVTFQQTDPLFVADLQDIKNPKIVGELKIPWYSTYLHPYMYKDGKQYLIWLGVDTEEFEKDRIQEIGVKVDLYEIDFNKKPIDVKQLHSLRLGWKQSFTPAINDFRSFIWNKEKKELTLPIFLTDSEKIKRCHNTIDYNSKWQKTTRENCYTMYDNKPSFIWNKVFNIDVEKWIQEINSTENYLNSLKNKIKGNNEDNTWQYYDLIQSSRALYNNNTNIFLSPYLIWVKKDWKTKIINLQPKEMYKDVYY